MYIFMFMLVLSGKVHKVVVIYCVFVFRLQCSQILNLSYEIPIKNIQEKNN